MHPENHGNRTNRFRSPLSCELGVRSIHFIKPSIAPDCDDSRRTFRVTHPFHPLFGHQFKLVTYRNNWAERHVYYKDSKERLRCMPAEWTDIGPQDPYIALSQGRSFFRIEDLLELGSIIQDLKNINKGEK